MTHSNLAAALYHWSRKQPGHPALVTPKRSLSYGEMTEEVARVAGWICRNGRRPVPRVGLLACRSAEAYVGILAAASAGASFVPISHKAPPSYRQEILRAAAVDLLLVDETGAELLESTPDIPPGVPVLALAPPAEGIPHPVARLDHLDPAVRLDEPVPVEASAEAYLMFTSGTTGRPKGIMVNHGNISHLLGALEERYALDPSDRVSQHFELTFDPAVADIFLSLRAGASLHVVPDSHLAAPAAFIREERITVWSSVPSVVGFLKQMRMLFPNAFPDLRLSLFCGEALPRECVETWQEAAPRSRIENLYGPTEATVYCLAHNCDALEPVTTERQTMAIGRPLTGLHAAIIDAGHNFLQPGERGELAVCGPQVTEGYIGNDLLTRQRFIDLVHPELGSRRWYLTGDVAYCDQSGIFHFLGRADNQVKLRGQRIELDEIDCHLRLVSGSDNAISIFLPADNPWEQEIIGIVSGTRRSVGEIRQALRSRLPGYMVPKRILTLDELPRTTSGKIDRKALLARAAGGSLCRSTPEKDGSQ